MNRNNRVKLNRHQLAGQPRRGALIVCVLVLLLIVGLMISQTMQTLMLVRRGDAVRQRLRQTRELIELGELILQQQATDELPGGPLLVSLAAPASEPSNSTSKRGSITFIPIDPGDTNHSHVRIAVTYPLGSSQELTATQIVIRQENLDAKQP